MGLAIIFRSLHEPIYRNCSFLVLTRKVILWFRTAVTSKRHLLCGGVHLFDKDVLFSLIFYVTKFYACSLSFEDPPSPIPIDTTEHQTGSWHIDFAKHIFICIILLFIVRTSSVLCQLDGPRV